MQHGIAIGPAEQAEVASGAADRQVADGVAETVELAGERLAIPVPEIRVPHRLEASRPAGRGASVDVRAQHVVAGKVGGGDGGCAVHALQVRPRGAVLGAEGGYDGPVDCGGGAVLGAEIEARRKTDLRAVAQRIIPSAPALAVLQRQTRRAGTVEVGVDIDIAMGSQR